MAWNPPAKPDLRAILREAREDAMQGRYDEALAKHVWFFENALEIESGFYGVRLSFALADWARLAEAHAPALAAMRSARDRAEQQIAAERDAGGDLFGAFADFAALNDRLGDVNRTVGLFIELDTESPDAAEQLYRVAERRLVEAGEFDLCGRYVQPQPALESAISAHRDHIERLNGVESSYKRRQMEAAANRLLCDASTCLIAILLRNGRDEEATQVGDVVRQCLTESRERERIEAALRGEPPTRG